RGGPRGRVIPGSIPNPEVKPPIADNTYPVWIGNVGRCLFDFFFYSFFIPFIYSLPLFTTALFPFLPSYLFYSFLLFDIMQN
ncbi:MAG: Unknown protein, partial [uncultured Sulfurovum sp.]